VYQGRPDLASEPDSYLHNVAVDTPLRTLREAVAGSDVFLGLSAGNLLSPEMLLSMNRWAPGPGCWGCWGWGWGWGCCCCWGWQRWEAVRWLAVGRLPC
jgi:hypothetical protein